jgi:serine phosphatase RsbU (regulator of sigma subunit)
VELLRDGRGAPLGGMAAARYAQGRVRLGEGDSLVLYSDGLVERRDLGLDTGFARLGAAAGRPSRAPLETVCDGLLAALGAGAATDDIALLVARRTAPAR